MLQHKRASAQACFSTSVLQHKRQQKLVERSNRIKASAETVKLHPTQWSSGFSTSVSRSLSSEAINQRLQQKQPSFIRSNRAAASEQACFGTSVPEHKCQQKLVERSNRSAASAETFEIHPKQWTSGLSTSASRSLSSEAFDQRLQQKKLSFIRSN